MMLNAHHDTDINDNEKVQSYEGDPDKWKRRGKCPGHRNVEDVNRGGGLNPPHLTQFRFSLILQIYIYGIYVSNLSDVDGVVVGCKS